AENARAVFLENLRIANGSDAWLLNVLTGEEEIEKAWKARGSSWGYTITKDAWKAFDEHMNKARKALTEAWKEAPTRPEPAVAMITVAMAEGQLPNAVEERTWFDRAVTAQLDYWPAYKNMLWALRPRWRGSHEEMEAFGLACLNTKRYDPQVP